MDLIESYIGIQGFCNFTNETSFSVAQGFCNFTDQADCGHLEGSVNFRKSEPEEFPYIQGKCNFVSGNYFPSFRKEVQTTTEELASSFGSNAYLLCPDIGKAYVIPHEDLLSVRGFRWYANSPVRGTIRLKNFDGKYTDPNNEDFGNLITEEIWSPERNTRKFIALEHMSICGDVGECVLYPRMVIARVTGTTILTLELNCDISEYLYRDPECPSYCFEEALLRVDGTHYMSQTLTNFYYDRSKNSELLKNYEQLSSGFSLDNETCIVELANEVENEQIPVVLKNPMSTKEIINGDKGILRKVIDAQDEGFPKEYIDVVMNFQDFPVYTEIQTQGSDVITILKRNLLDAIPADFLTMPVMGHIPETDREVEAYAILNKKFTLIIQDCVLDEELPEPSYNLTPYLMRETPEPNRTGVNKINTTSIIKEITLGNFYTLQLTSTQEPVVEEEPVPVPTSLPLTTGTQGHSVTMVSSVTGMALSIAGAYNPDGTIKEPFTIVPNVGMQETPFVRF